MKVRAWSLIKHDGKWLGSAYSTFLEMRLFRQGQHLLLLLAGKFRFSVGVK